MMINAQNRTNISRVIIIVLDGAGIGALPDAAEFGDEGSNTLANTARAIGGLNLPNLEQMGLGNLADIMGVKPMPNCKSAYGIMHERSKGKDTIIGHWEMMGVITERPFPVYPNGFPKEIIEQFEKEIGRKVLGNVAASGTEIIKQLGKEHMKTGYPIVYTSADSVFQIAAHESIIPVEELYDMCLKARKILTGEHNVARVIARPFIGEPGNFVRTYNRRDFSISPPKPTALDALQKAGYYVIGVGKICDIFSHQGIDKCVHTEGNPDSIARTIDEINEPIPGLVFSNLVDFDSKYGHRNDPVGFAFGLKEFDDSLPDIKSAMADDDLLIITADHGVDPTTQSTDHSREQVPLLVWHKNINTVDLGIRPTFSDIAATITEIFKLNYDPPGTSFANDVL